ncbi:hypothetical protein J1605_003743 [Eschrichtius robustus]|uniref:Uncharacterized protein n=1 Tax=Eschrichtius robustus TaxID=9764 RepID=A0AB34HN12_ESCRO|nr:hypothetical protein J1605_003743 [Eschrichtius robustus]
MRDLSTPPRDQTQAPCGGSAESKPLDCQGSPKRTRVQALVREDPTCRGATKPVRHNYWACALEPMSHNY